MRLFKTRDSGLCGTKNFSAIISTGKTNNIRAKPLDFRTSTGENVFGQETSAPRTELVPYAYGGGGSNFYIWELFCFTE